MPNPYAQVGSGSYWDDQDTYLDRSDFRTYARRIEQIVHTAGETGITIRAIHEALGCEANYNWTQDALESLRSVEGTGLLPTRFRPVAGVEPEFLRFKRLARKLSKQAARAAQITTQEKTDEH